MSPAGDERVRLFVALELAPSVRTALATWRPSLAGLRLLDLDDLHVTLCFLGWRSAGEVEAILQACRVVAGAGGAPLALGEAVWLPARHPRVLAVTLEDARGALAAIQARLSSALEAGGWYGPEPRPFLAHVTVARVAKEARQRAVDLPAPPALAFSGSRVTLFRSRLGPQGARYEPLGAVELDDGELDGEDPVGVVRRFYAAQARAYARGELDGVAELLCEDVVWHVPGESAIAGEHIGRAAVLAYLRRRRALTDATFRVSVHGAALIADRVVQLAGGRATRGGRDLTWETVGVFSVRAGRIAECWLIPFDQREFDQIWA